jgi:predicted DsbA family dithiol-disulfide isomerase
VQEATIEQIIEEQKGTAAADLVPALERSGPVPFSRILTAVLEAYMLRETNIKDICVDLAKTGTIENTWGAGNRKPRDETIIKLKTDP